MICKTSGPQVQSPCVSQFDEGHVNRVVIVPDHIKDWTIVLQLGAECGSLTLYGMQTEQGWVFCRNLIDWTPQLIDEERIQHKSPVVDSWGAALTLLDQYPWQTLFPLVVHPKFSKPNLVCSTKSI